MVGGAKADPDIATQHNGESSGIVTDVLCPIHRVNRLLALASNVHLRKTVIIASNILYHMV